MGFFVTAAFLSPGAAARIHLHRARSWLVGPDHSTSLVFTFPILIGFADLRGTSSLGAPSGRCDLGLATSCPSSHLRRRIALLTTRRARARSVRFSQSRSVRCVLVSRASSLGVLKDHPSIDMRSRSPLLLGFTASCVSKLRSRAASTSTRSARAVSHDFDGLLLLARCGLVASRCQSWDSSRFWRSWGARLRGSRLTVVASQTHPLRCPGGSSLSSPGLSTAC
jgi:hypothetical protein